MRMDKWKDHTVKNELNLVDKKKKNSNIKYQNENKNVL